MEQNEVTTETKMVLIQQERQLWLNTREMMTMRYRVQKRLNSKEGMETCEKELANCENALDELDKIMIELQEAK
jgi:hypothetical protein